MHLIIQVHKKIPAGTFSTAQNNMIPFFFTIIPSCLESSKQMLHINQPKNVL